MASEADARPITRDRAEEAPLAAEAVETWLKFRVFSPALILMLAGAGGAVAAWPTPTPFAWRLCTALGFAYLGSVYAFGSDALVLRLGQVSSRKYALRTWRHVGIAGLVAGALLATSALLRRFAPHT